MEIFGQIVGFLAIGTTIVIYSQKDRKKLLLYKLLADILWISHFMLIGAYSGMATMLIAIFRELLFVNRDKYRVFQNQIWVVLFSGAYLISAYFTWRNIFSIFPAIASTIATIGFWKREVSQIRYMSLIVSVFMLAYGIAMGSIATIFNEIFTMSSIGITIYRQYK